jgi:hypothetical protein
MIHGHRSGTTEGGNVCKTSIDADINVRVRASDRDRPDPSGGLGVQIPSAPLFFAPLSALITFLRLVRDEWPGHVLIEVDISDPAFGGAR